MKIYINNKKYEYNNLSELIDTLYIKGYIKKIDDKYYTKVNKNSSLKYIRNDEDILKDIEVLTNGKVKIKYRKNGNI